MNIKKISFVLELTEKIVKFIENDKHLNQFKGLLDSIKISEKNLREKKYVVSVVAAMKAGKSTSFNAFLGRDLLPNENAACTTAITEIKHAQRESDFVSKIYRNGKKVNIKASAGNTLEENFHQDVRMSRKNNEVKDLEKYYLESPIIAIEGSEYKELIQNFVLVDTPGPNEANIGDFDVAELQKMALDQLLHSDALIILLDYQSYKSDTNALILKNIFEKREDLKKDQDKIYFLINKIDSLGPKDGTVDDVIKNVRSLIKEHAPIISEPKIFAFSAKQAMLSRIVANGKATSQMKQDMLRTYGSRYITEKKYEGKTNYIIPQPEELAPQLLADSKVEVIEKSIIKNIFDRSSENFYKNGVEKIEINCENIKSNAKSQIEMYQTDEKKINEDFEKCNDMIKSITNEGESLKHIPRKHLGEMKTQITQIIRELPAKIKEAVEQSLPSSDSISSEDQSILRDRVTSINRDIANAITINVNHFKDRILRTCYCHQNLINQELNEKFFALSIKASKIVNSNSSISLQVFNILDNVNINNLEKSHIGENISTENVDDGTKVEKKYNVEKGMAAATATAAVTYTTGVAIGTAAATAATAAMQASSIAAIATAGAAAGSFVPVIGTVIGATLAGGCALLAGLIFSREEKVEQKKKTLHTVDLTPIKEECKRKAENVSSDISKNISANINMIENHYIEFVDKQLNEFINQLDEYIHTVKKTYLENKNNKQEHIRHMNAILSAATAFEKELSSIK